MGVQIHRGRRWNGGCLGLEGEGTGQESCCLMGMEYDVCKMKKFCRSVTHNMNILNCAAEH
jgi:hypothetical protein